MKKPVVNHYAAAKPFLAQQSSSNRVAQAAGKMLCQRLGASPPVGEPVRQELRITLQVVASVSSIRQLDDLGRQEPRLNRGSNALTALSIGKSGGITNEHDGIIHQLPARVAEQQVSMSSQPLARIKCQLSRRSQELKKTADVVRKGVLV